MMYFSVHAMMEYRFVHDHNGVIVHCFHIMLICLKSSGGGGRGVGDAFQAHCLDKFAVLTQKQNTKILLLNIAS